MNKRMIAYILCIVFLLNILPAFGEELDFDAVEDYAEIIDAAVEESDLLENEWDEISEMIIPDEPEIPQVVTDEIEDAPVEMLEESGSYCGDSITWSLNEDEGELLITGSGSMWDFGNQGEPWFGRNVRSVVVSEGIDSIGCYAFDCCVDLKSVSLPSTLKYISDYGFNSCIALESITLPEGLEVVGSSAFHNCTSLKSIVLPGTVNYVQSTAFDNCTALEEAYIPGSVYSIGEQAFSNCANLTKVTIEEGVQSIGDKAFAYGNSLESIVLPNSITYYGESVFAFSNALKYVEMGNGAAYLGSRIFQNDKALQKVVLPAALETVDSYAFEECTALSEIVLPETLRSISYKAFANCTRLEELMIPESVTIIDTNAFVMDEALTLLVMPDSYAEQWAQNNNFRYAYATYQSMAEIKVHLGSFSGFEGCGLWLKRLSDGATRKMKLGYGDTWRFANLIENGEYEISLRDPYGNVICEDTVTAGTGVMVTWNDAAVPVTLYANAGNVTDGDNVRFEWYNAAGDLLGIGSTLEMVAQGAQIKLKAVPDGFYLMPDVCDITVSESNREYTVVLSRPELVDVTGCVIDPAGGYAVKGAEIIAQQSIGGRRLSICTVTDTDGKFSLELYSLSAKITVSHADYNDAVLNVELDGDTDIGAVTPVRGEGVRVTPVISYMPASEGDEEVYAVSIDSLYKLDISVFNMTRDMKITDIIRMEKNILLPAESAQPGDELVFSVGAVDAGLVPQDITVTVSEDGRCEFKTQMTERGSFRAEFGYTSQQDNIALVYNGDGELVWSGRFSSELSGCRPLPAGIYTAVFIANDNRIGIPERIDELKELGLKEENDYTYTSVTITDGNIAVLDITGIPQPVVGRFECADPLKTEFAVNKSTVPAGSYVSFKVFAGLREEYAETISDARLAFEYPSGMELAEGSVSVNGKFDAVYDSEPGILRVYPEHVDDMVRFCMLPLTAGNYTVNAYLEVTVNDEAKRQRIGTVAVECTALSFSVPGTVSEKDFTLTGIASPRARVTMYIDGKPAERVTAGAAGTWRINVHLNTTYDWEVHTLALKAVTLQGSTIVSETKKIIYSKQKAQATKIRMYNTAHPAGIVDPQEFVTEIDLLHPSGNSINYYWWSAYPQFSFVIETNGDRQDIAKVYLTVNQQYGSQQSLEAEYNEKLGGWAATGDFSVIERKIAVSGGSTFTVMVDGGPPTGFSVFVEYKDGTSQISQTYLNALLREEQAKDDVVQEILSEIYTDAILEEGGFTRIVETDTLEYRDGLYIGEVVSYLINGELRQLIMVEADVLNESELNRIIDSDEQLLKVSDNIYIKAADDGTVSEATIIIAETGQRIVMVTAFQSVEEASDVDMQSLDGTGRTASALDQKWKNEYDAFKKKTWDGFIENLNNYIKDSLKEYVDEIIDKYVPKNEFESIKDQCEKEIKSYRELFEKYGESYNNLKEIADRISKGCGQTLGENTLLRFRYEFNRALITGAAIGDTITKFISDYGPEGPVKKLSDWCQKIFNWTGTTVFDLMTLDLKADLDYYEQQEMIIREIADSVKDLPYMPPYETKGICEPASQEKKPQITVTPLDDPSGYVYEAVPSNRLEGVTTVLYTRETVEDIYGDDTVQVRMAESTDVPQVNPQTTGVAGEYGWDVPAGEWRVRFSKSGYESAVTDWMTVPPPRFNVNVGLVNYAQPRVEEVTAFDDSVRFSFDRYMDIDSVKDAIRVWNSGKRVVGTINAVNAESDPASGNTYASVFEFVPLTAMDAYTVRAEVLSAAESYAGVALGQKNSQEVYVRSRIESFEIELPDLEVGETGEIIIRAYPQNVAYGTVPEITGGSICFSIDEFSGFDYEGICRIPVTAVISGTGIITINADGIKQTAELKIKEHTETGYVARPDASVPAGEIVCGTQVELTCATKGAVIYYTIDGTCPCDEETRILYTGPITITASCKLRACAVKENWEESPVSVWGYVVLFDPAESISLREEKMVMGKGCTLNMDAQVQPFTADRAMAWSSSKNSIVKVDENGNVTALKAGKATITAETTDGTGLKAKCVITVKAAPKKAPILSAKKLSVCCGTEKTLTAKLADGGSQLHWSSEDETIAVVDQKGCITAVTPGVVGIVVSTFNGKSARCEVTVDPAPEYIGMDLFMFELMKGKTYTLRPYIYPEDAHQTVTWSSSDVKIAKVSSAGKVTAVQPGAATITARTANGLETNCYVLVTAIPKKVTLSSKKEKLFVGDSTWIYASVLPDTSSQQVQWSSSAPAVATVDATGWINVVGRGKAVITAKTPNGKKASCTVYGYFIPEGIALNKTEISVARKKTLTLKAAVKPVGAMPDVSWVSSDPSVATVSASGVVKGVNAGTAVIYASTVNGFIAECQVTVK